MGFDCFIFDFDGTLARSDAAYSAAFRHSIKLHTGQDIDEAALAGFWGMNMTPQDMLRPYCDSDLSPMIFSFEQHYYANHHVTLSAYDGIPDALRRLKNERALIGIVSLKPRRAGERELEITGIAEVVDARIWGDEVTAPKPHPAGVNKIMAQLSAVAGRTIVIGDSAADIVMGRAAGVTTGAALWGQAKHEGLLAAEPDFEFHSPDQLLSLISVS